MPKRNMPEIALLAHFILCGVGPAMSGVTRAANPTDSGAFQNVGNNCKGHISSDIFEAVLEIGSKFKAFATSVR